MPGMSHLLLVVQPASAAGHGHVRQRFRPGWTWFGSIRALYCAQRSARRGDGTGDPLDDKGGGQVGRHVARAV